MKEQATVCETFYKTYKKLFEAVKLKSKKNYYCDLLLKYKDNVKNT